MAIKIYESQIRPTGETGAVQTRRDQRISMETATQIGRAVKGAASSAMDFWKEIEVRKSENEVLEKIKKIEQGDDQFEGLISIKEKASRTDDPDRAAKIYNEGFALAKGYTGDFEHRFTKELFNKYLKKKEIADGIDVRESSNKLFLSKSATLDQEKVNGLERRIVYPDSETDQNLAMQELEEHFNNPRFVNLHGANSEKIKNTTKENIEFYTAKRIIRERGVAAGDEYISKTKYLNTDQIDKLKKIKKTTADGNNALINDELNTLASMAEEGITNQDQLIAIGQIIEKHGTTKQKIKYQDVTENFAVINSLNNMSVTEIDNYIKDARGKISPTKADPKLFKTIQAAEKYRAKLISDTQKDPITAASKRGVLDINNIDFAKAFSGNKDERDEFITNLKVRKNQSEIVKNFYGTPKKFFTEAETNQLTTFLDGLNDYNSIIKFTSAMSDGFGKDSPLAFNELSKSNEFFAHVGGLSNINANLPQIKMAIDGYLLQKNKKIDINLSEADTGPSKNKYTNVFPDNQQTYNSVIDFAEKIYATKAFKGNFKVFKPSVFEDSIREAFGEQGEYGGITEFKNEYVHVPNWLKKNEFDNIIEFMKDKPEMIIKASSVKGFSDDFQTEPDIDINGRPVDERDREIDIFSEQEPYFISIGYGRYKVALGDHPSKPNGNAQYVIDGNYTSSNNPYFIIDLNKIKDDYLTRKR